MLLFGAGNDSRAKGRFLSMEGQGESKLWLMALPELGRLSDTGAGGTQGWSEHPPQEPLQNNKSET